MNFNDTPRAPIGCTVVLQSETGDKSLSVDVPVPVVNALADNMPVPVAAIMWLVNEPESCLLYPPEAVALALNATVEELARGTRPTAPGAGDPNLN